MYKVLFLFSLVLVLSHSTAEAKKDEEKTPEFWTNSAQKELENAINLQKLNTNVARNVILFLGDGMNVPTITAGRIFKGQMQGHSGEETVLAMDQFHHTGLSKTYSVDRQVSDSACTATAYLCGVKGNYYTIGLSGKAKRNNCKSSKGAEVDSILVDAFRAGKSTGVVTTTRINHASPAGTYAHTPSRSWYSDADLPDEAVKNGCKDIAKQFYHNSGKITVALGGGRKYFMPESTFDPEYEGDRNKRKDGLDLIDKWKKTHSRNGSQAKYVWNKTDFDKVDPATTDRLLGLFQPGDMNYEADRKNDEAGEPSLAEMTEKSIRILQKNPKGYFLFVEGGRIDHAHHATNAYRALHDFVAFDNAIAKAVEMTSDNDTLIVVTSDHSHTFNFGGNSDRGNPILGLSKTEGRTNLALDKKPFTTLLYGNGRGYQGGNSLETSAHSRKDLTNYATDNIAYQQQTGVPLYSETHGGDDVTIMTRGPMSHLIHGVHEQSYIAHMMRYASCVGSNTKHCRKEDMGITSAPVVKRAGKFLGGGFNSTSTKIKN